MKIIILDTYDRRFLDRHYQSHPALAQQSYQTQLDNLLALVFGTSDFYSRHLNGLGHDAQDIIVNCIPLQLAWCRENGQRYSRLAMRIPHRLLRAPVVGPWFSSLPGPVEIAIAQIKAARPDVLYCQDLWFLPPAAMAAIRPYVKLIVGQCGSRPPALPYLKSYDLLTTSFPHFVSRLQAQGLNAEYFRIAFDDRVLDLLAPSSPDLDFTFVGGISRHHGNTLHVLEYLAEHTPIEFFGYGANQVGRNSPIRQRHHGEVWGMDMYRAVARSRITFNRHGHIAENFANNMRLFEATGVGAMLLTDYKDNLGNLFEIGKEVVAYSSPEEAVELIKHYVSHPDEALAIAKAGQARTLAEHTYEMRMHELAAILERRLAAKA